MRIEKSMFAVSMFAILLIATAFSGCGSSEEGSEKHDNIITEAKEQATSTACSSNMMMIKQSVDFYFVENGVFPKSLSELVPNYIQKLPACPDNGKYSFSIKADMAVVECSIHGESR